MKKLYTEQLKKHILFDPLGLDVNQLYIVAGYATPNMASWLMRNIELPNNRKIDINLVVGMVPLDGLSVSVHNGFQELMSEELPDSVNSFTCSYVYNSRPVHSKLYIWAKNGIPVKAFTGSANFTQAAFGTNRRELMYECDPAEAMSYYEQIEGNSIYCNHAEIEEYVLLHPTHEILDRDNRVLTPFEEAGIESVTLSLLTKTGETGSKSGINWGQRSGRNPNEAYISLPAHIARSGFFPLEKAHFTVVTDDGHTLILRVEQQNDKAITTPLSNALLGEYIRNRIGVANGAYVWKRDLINYGRTDIKFYKFDDEQFYMEFGV